MSTTGRKAGPPRPVYPSSAVNTTAKRNENDVYDPITGDLMISSEGYPDLLPHGLSTYAYIVWTTDS